MTKQSIAVLAVASLSLCACATITRGTKEVMVIESNPIGAVVQLTNDKMEEEMTCTTPCTVKMSRKRGFDVVISKEGYETVETKVITQVSGGGAAGMAGNVVLGGLIGAGVDASTGAMNKFSPNPLVVALVPTDGSPAAPAAVEFELQEVPADEDVDVDMSTDLGA